MIKVRTNYCITDYHQEQRPKSHRIPPSSEKTEGKESIADYSYTGYENKFTVNVIYYMYTLSSQNDYMKCAAHFSFSLSECEPSFRQEFGARHNSSPEKEQKII